MRALTPLQFAATALASARLARGRSRRPPLASPAAAGHDGATISVVIPARNEERRLGPCLDGLRGDPDVTETVVVDDGSSDGTAALADRLGARVVAAGPPPPGWVGKPWALQRGLEEARGEIVVSLDADTRPRPGLAGALRAALADGADYVSAGARFRCDSAAERWLHPALLATLVVRYGPPDATAPRSPERLLVNGQCTAVRRRRLLDAGGYGPAAAHMTDDAAEARALARAGWRVVFHDAGALLTVDMHDSGGELWREWGRSIALADVTPPRVRAVDAATVWLVLALPPLRVLSGRAGWLDRILLIARAFIAVALAPAYEARGVAYWLSPLADPVAAVRLVLSALRPPRRWRGRIYDARAAAGTERRSGS